MKFYLILIAAIIFFGSCTPKEQILDYKIMQYKLVDKGYQYTNNRYVYKERYYTPISIAEYTGNDLTSVTVFKSEGKLKYTMKDLRSDVNFFKMLNIPAKRNLEIKNNVLIDNNIKREIYEYKKDSIFCIDKKGLTIYSLPNS